MAFLELRWNYSPLKEKAVQLPDGLFVSFVAALLGRVVGLALNLLLGAQTAKNFIRG